MGGRWRQKRIFILGIVEWQHWVLLFLIAVSAVAQGVQEIGTGWWLHWLVCRRTIVFQIAFADHLATAAVMAVLWVMLKVGEIMFALRAVILVVVLGHNFGWFFCDLANLHALVLSLN